MKTNYFLGTSADGFHRVVYTEWGQPIPAKPTLICVHGLLRNRHDFDALANFLSLQGRHIFCPDIAGRGDSDWFKNPQHYNFEQYIADMTALIARSSATEIDWIGTSMGGLIGMMMAALPNSPIRRLVLNDVGPQVPLHGLRRLSKYADTHTTFSSKEEAKQYYQKIYAGFGDLSESQWIDFTEHSITRRSDGKYIAKCDPNISHNKTPTQFLWELVLHPHKTLEGIFFDIDLWHIWRQVSCPVLIIHGRHSDILLSEHITKMQEIHPHTDLIEIENAGHAPALLELTEHEKIKNWLQA
ncbi:alpha/beta fold hydrolase [Legionella sp. CNM-1927-20]|uniref:alpha/beta fold hydrolase n=1 Tax=Legionella sp. CNM-1927-20 TaxID=3422221 RepID=UPI00403B0586